MRLYALYSLNKKVLALMVVCFVASTSASAAVMGNVVFNITGMKPAFAQYPSTRADCHTAIAFRPLPWMVFCAPISVSSHFFAFWIPMLAFESLLCGLALFKGFKTFRSSASAFHSGRHLVSILIRDSVLYFLV
jgi:hypothetical protein